LCQYDVASTLRTTKTYFVIFIDAWIKSNCVVVCFRSSWVLKSSWDDISIDDSIVRDSDASAIDRRRTVIVTNCCAEKENADRKIAYIASEIINFRQIKEDWSFVRCWHCVESFFQTQLTHVSSLRTSRS
jgi:hypothetical protein